MNIMPTGGINLDNLSEWKQAGAVVVGVGGNLFKDVKENGFIQVTNASKEYLEKWQNS